MRDKKKREKTGEDMGFHDDSSRRDGYNENVLLSPVDSLCSMSWQQLQRGTELQGQNTKCDSCPMFQHILVL